MKRNRSETRAAKLKVSYFISFNKPLKKTTYDYDYLYLSTPPRFHLSSRVCGAVNRAHEKYIKEKQKPNKTGNRILNGRHVVSVISETEWIVELIAVDLNLSRLVRAPRVRSVNRRAGRNTRRPQRDDQFNKKRTAAVLFKHISLAPGSFFWF